LTKKYKFFKDRLRNARRKRREFVWIGRAIEFVGFRTTQLEDIEMVRFLTALSLIVICTGCGSPPPVDSKGQMPIDVVNLAYEAALAGDYDKANSFGTENFKKFELRFRKGIESGKFKASTPSAAWASKVNRSKPGDKITLESQKWKKKEKSLVSVKIKRSWTMPANVYVVLSEGEWKLAAPDDYIMK